METLLYVAQLAAFTGCVCIGVFVKHADVRCGIEAARVPFPVAASLRATDSLARTPEQLDVPCDAEALGTETS